MSEPVFDAFALPPALDAGELVLGHYDEPEVRVRYVDAAVEWVYSLTEALRSAGDRLAARPSGEIVGALGRAGRRFLDPDDPLRRRALDLLPPTSRLSPPMAAAVLDGMAADWTEERLHRLLRAELGDAEALDGFVAGGTARCMALGPRLCVQIVAGSVPGVGVNALLRSLLVKGPTLLKPGRGDVVLPCLFARALAEEDRDLADAVAVAYWPGGDPAVEDVALAAADVVAVYGSDDTVRDLRARTAVTARFIPYHHRVSVGVVGREALESDVLRGRAAADVAEAVAAFDQRGCVSPRTVFLEADEDVAAAFARSLADRLASIEERMPTGSLDSGEASTLHQLRGTVELMAASDEATVIHGGAAAWTVILGARDSALGACAGRTIDLRVVSDVAEVAGILEPLGPHLQSVGVAGVGSRLERLSGMLGRIGVSRVVPFRSMAFPPPWWHHDGRGPLQDLVRWLDLEGE